MVLDGMTEQIVVFDKLLLPTFQNKSFSRGSLPFKFDSLFKFIDKTDPFEWSCEDAGITRTFVCSFSRLADQTGTILMIDEITDLKRKDELLKTQEKNLINSSRLASLGEMAAGIAHEINNPLAVIIGRCELILSDIATGTATDLEVNKSLFKINEMALRISKVVISMRKISRAEAQELASTKLIDVIEDVLNLSAEKIRHSSIEIDLSGLHQETLVQINFSQFSQVLLNLIGNSIDELQKNSDGHKKIWLSDEECDDQVIFKIKDSGAGIPQETREKLFQPFFTTKEIGKGTGLGLSISKSLMQGMGGDLVLSPDLTHSCFLLKLIKG